MLVARTLRCWALATLRQTMGLGLFVAGCGAVFVGTVYGQIARDGSLGQTAGQLAGPSYTIGVQNAAEQIRGSNLFHSFSDFNVNTGESATFTGPDTIAQIINRVTGGNLSNLRRTSGLQYRRPSANFFTESQWRGGRAQCELQRWRFGTFEHRRLCPDERWGAVLCQPREAKYVDERTDDGFWILGGHNTENDYSAVGCRPGAACRSCRGESEAPVGVGLRRAPHSRSSEAIYLSLGAPLDTNGGSMRLVTFFGWGSVAQCWTKWESYTEPGG